MPSPHPLAGYAARLRLGAEVEEAVPAVRAWFADHGRDEFLWLCGPSTTPRDLEARLTTMGARPDAEDPVWAGMMLSEAPARTAGIDVRKVQELDEALRCVEITAADRPPAARGRGAYRALVRARWDEAVRRRTPMLVVQAGSMSKPILRRLGFREVCEIRAFTDSSRATSGFKICPL